MMKSNRHFKTIIVSVGILIVIQIIGCRTMKVPLNNFNPALPAEYNAYRGKPVYLMNFDNQANNTSIWNYYSQDKNFSYSTNDTLHNFFWYAFQNAFTKAGMRVSNVDNPDLAAPAMWVTLLSITDEHYQVRVTVQKKGVPVFTEKYTVQEHPVQEKDRNPDVLEQRAYRMTNRLIRTILEDPGFKKEITKT